MDIIVNEEINENNELELSSEQVARIDEIHNAVFEMCKILLEDDDLEWNMEIIGDIADVATDILVEKGHRVHYPAIVYEDDNDEIGTIYDFVEPEESNDN